MGTVPFANVSPTTGGMLIPGMGGGNASGTSTALPGMPNPGPAPFSQGNIFSLFPANGTVPFDFSSLLPGGKDGANGFNIFGNTTGAKQAGSSLDTLFGKHFGPTVTSALASGGFNPAILQAFINQSMPLYQRGMEGIANEFSGIGNRFSSAAATGMGDFSSQFFNNLLAQIAGFDNRAIDRSFGLLGGLLPYDAQKTAQDQANSSGLLGNILGLAGTVAPLIPGVGPFIGAGLDVINGVKGNRNGGTATGGTPPFFPSGSTFSDGNFGSDGSPFPTFPIGANGGVFPA